MDAADLRRVAHAAAPVFRLEIKFLIVSGGRAATPRGAGP